MSKGFYLLLAALILTMFVGCIDIDDEEFASFDISPDGNKVAFVSTNDGTTPFLFLSEKTK